MKRTSRIGLSLLTVGMLAAGCSPASDAEYSSTEIDSAVRHLYEQNGEETNGTRVNGTRVNGTRVNGTRVNGTTTNSLSISQVATELIGFLFGTNTTIRGADFAPAILSAVLEDGSEAIVYVTDHKTQTVAGLADPLDYYMAIDPFSGESICGRDDSNQPVWAMPLTRTFNQYNGKSVVSVDMFSLNCYGGALEKCVRYGYPDWISRNESLNASTKSRTIDNYHDACVNLVRADYCGDGQPHTITGTTIDIYDNLAFNTPDTTGSGADGFLFEAEWDTTGAWCINKTRWMPSSLSKSLANNNSNSNPDWAYIKTHCPERIAGASWPGNPDGKSTPRACGTGSDYTATNGFNVANQAERALLRVNTPLYQY